jgi:hypothetical protein
MKIALCLSGGLRNFKDTYFSFKNFLLDKHDVDVFFYGLENKEGIEKNKKDLIDLYNPKKFHINTEDFYKNIKSVIFEYNQKKEANTYYSFFNVMKCIELKSEYEKENRFKYDIVIRSRTDCFWFREITEDELKDAQSNIITPIEWSFKEVNYFSRFDGFAIGSSEMMDDYSCLFKRIDEYSSKINPILHGESMIGYHLMINNIPNIEKNRCIIFEYPSKSIEKFIYPYKFIKYFDNLSEDDIKDPNYYAHISNKRKDF